MSTLTSRKIIVLGLPWTTNEEGLKEYFRKYGDIDEAVIIRLPSGKSKGFGFVIFNNDEDCQRVLDEPEHMVEGRRVDVKLAIPREEMDHGDKGRGTNFPKTNKIFVGRLASTDTYEDLRDYFSQFGKITDVYIPQSHHYQGSRGFGFVTFEETEAVERITAIKEHELKGKKIVIDRAEPKREERGGYSRFDDHHYGGGRSDRFIRYQPPGPMPGYGHHPHGHGDGYFPPQYGNDPYGAPPPHPYTTPSPYGSHPYATPYGSYSSTELAGSRFISSVGPHHRSARHERAYNPYRVERR